MTSSNPVTRFYRWWITSLSELLTRRRTAAQSWRTLLKNTPTGLEIHTRDSRSTKLLGTLGVDAGDDQTSILKSIIGKEASTNTRHVLVRMAPSDVLARTIQIPAAASDVIAPVLANQMERMVPWPDGETRYGYRIVGPNAERPEQLDVEVVATTKDILESMLQRAQSVGLSPFAVDFESASDSTMSIELMSLQPNPARKTAAILNTAFAGLLAVTLMTAGFGLYQLWNREVESTGLESEITAAQTRVAEIGRLAEENDRLRDQRGRLVRKKTEEPAIMVLIEVLSRALPDTAYLTDLEIEGREVRIAGKSVNATALITKLEDTPQFQDVRFSAPTTREVGESFESFSIVGRAQGGSDLEMAP